MQSQQDEKAKVRSVLVDAHVRCLPRVQRKLLFGPDKPAHQATTLTEGINNAHPKRSCLLQFIKEHFFFKYRSISIAKEFSSDSGFKSWFRFHAYTASVFANHWKRALYFAVARPKPLSTVVRKVDKGRPLSRAVILSSAMDKVHEIRYMFTTFHCFFTVYPECAMHEIVISIFCRLIISA